jgi:hypothetical protein
MELDCSEDPEACVEPLDGPSEGPEVSDTDDEPDGGRVIAEP